MILSFAILAQAFVSLSVASAPLSHDFTSMVKNADSVPVSTAHFQDCLDSDQIEEETDESESQRADSSELDQVLPLQIKGFSCFTTSAFHRFCFSLKMTSRVSPPLHRPPVL